MAGDLEQTSNPPPQEANEQVAARDQYFNRVIAPQIAPEDLQRAREAFNRGAPASEIVLHLASRHPGNEGKYNESNPGLGVRVPIAGDTSFGAGTYRNSLDKQSNYAGLIQKIMQIGPVDVSVAGGLISGYLDRPIPFLIPEASMKAGPGTLRVNAIPPVNFGGNKVDPAIGVSYGVPFK